MTYQEREEIFSREALHIKDVMELYGMKYDTASKFIRDMKLKRKVRGKPVRLDTEGFIHMIDYLEEIGVDPIHPGDRYVKKKPSDDFLISSVLQSSKKSVCL
jgi:hypothetical protein